MSKRSITLVALNAMLAVAVLVGAKTAVAAPTEEAKFDCCKQAVEGGFFCAYRDCYFFGDRCSTTEQCNLP